MSDFPVILKDKGEFRLPPEIADRYGYEPGQTIRVSLAAEGIFIHRGPERLRKVYLEPTNYCNLDCRTCVRRNWEDPLGLMEMETYVAFIQQLSRIPSLEAVQFGGYGEPLLHPEISRMIRMAKELGRKTELVSNGLLLDEALAAQLVEARLDTIVFSLEGLTEETYGRVRTGASFRQFREGIEILQRVKSQKRRVRPQIGLEFVAMKQNLPDLERLLSFAHEVEAIFVIVNNLLPHTEEMKDQVLYNNWTVIAPPFPLSSAHRGMRPQTFHDYAEIRLPKIQLTEESFHPLFKLLRFRSHEAPLMDTGGPRGLYCRFAQEGALAVNWEGTVSPCLALMHSYGCYILGRPKRIQRYQVGDIRERALADIWQDESYASFRTRVRAFEFSPCAECGGCSFSESNLEDCYGNPFPVCGDCLWARGIIQCP